MADHFSVRWFGDHAILPERLRHANQPQRQEKLLRDLKQFLGIISLHYTTPYSLYLDAFTYISCFYLKGYVSEMRQ